MDEVERVWRAVLRAAERGAVVRTKQGIARTFTRRGENSVEADEVTAPLITRSQIAEALGRYPLREWPRRRVSEVRDIGNTAYVWALLRYAAEEAAGDSEVPRRDDLIQRVHRLAGEKRGAERALHRAICAAAREDFSLRQIGDAAGVSHQTVAKIVADEGGLADES